MRRISSAESALSTRA